MDGRPNGVTLSLLEQLIAAENTNLAKLGQRKLHLLYVEWAGDLM